MEAVQTKDHPENDSLNQTGGGGRQTSKSMFNNWMHGSFTCVDKSAWMTACSITCSTKVKAPARLMLDDLCVSGRESQSGGYKEHREMCITQIGPFELLGCHD